MCHLISRGNRGADIFRGDGDRKLFLKTLAESCRKTEWAIHAHVLLGNHYRILLEVPEANLAGMKWLQVAHAQRFNVRHRVFGHVLQERYKARESFCGEAKRVHDEAAAEALPSRRLKASGAGGADLAGMAKGALEKQLLAWWLRKRTVASRGWISRRSHTGDQSRATQATAMVPRSTDSRTSRPCQRLDHLTS